MAAAQPFIDHQQRFASTRWTTIRACAGNDDAAHAARERLCQDYWYPVYAYVKRLGNDKHHSEDLTQDFFAFILKRPWFVQADQNKGRFRSFLLISVDRFLHDQHDRRNAKKRGGEYQHVPHSLSSTEATDATDKELSVDPAQIFESEWASAVVVSTLRQLEEEYRAAGKITHHAHLKAYLTKEASNSDYEATANDLKISAGNVKVMIHRLRKRYAAILRERVAATVAVPADVADEMRHLRSILATT